MQVMRSLTTTAVLSRRFACSQWELFIWPKDGGWTPVWEVPLIVAVVLASVVLSLLLFAVLLSWCGITGCVQ